MASARDAEAQRLPRNEEARDACPPQAQDRTLVVPPEPPSASSASSSARSADAASVSASSSSLNPHNDAVPSRSSLACHALPAPDTIAAPTAQVATPPPDEPLMNPSTPPPPSSPAPRRSPPLAAPAVVDTPATAGPEDERIPPALLRPYLWCPLCPPGTLVDAPITLRCGHTVCTAHIQDPDVAATIPANRDALTLAPGTAKFVLAFATCPVPGCPRGREQRPTGQAHACDPLGHPTRVNVTIRKLVDLFARVDLELQRSCHDRTRDDDDEPHSDHEEERPPEEDGSDDDLYLDPAPRPHPRPRAARNADRPRKRRRVVPERPRSAADEATVYAQFRKDLLSELTCEICYGMFYQPVTPPCQHTFCAKCLHRSMDHNDACPLCREPLPAYTYFQEGWCNEAILKILLTAFPAEYHENGSMIEADERHGTLDTPIFVAQLSFPGMPTMLHFFEPRYRLMLRRCLSMSRPHFGMVMAPRAGSQSQAEYGTMLEIRNVSMLPDGRSIVETWGTHRFRIMERGVMDGYVIGRVERVDDIDDEVPQPQEPNVGGGIYGGPTSGGNASAPSNEELLAVCHEFLEELKEGTPWVGQHLHNNYMAMPEDIAQFSFWMTLLLPIDESEKAKLLPIRSPRLRLRLVVHWIEQLRSNWHTAYASASRLQVVRWWMSALLVRALLRLFEGLYLLDEGVIRIEPLPPLYGGRWPRVPRSFFLGPFAPRWEPPDEAEIARLDAQARRHVRWQKFWTRAYAYAPYIGAVVAPVAAAALWAKFGRC